MGDDFFEVFRTASCAVAGIYLMSSIGYILGRNGLMDPEFNRRLARIAMNFFGPALTIGTAGSYTGEDLKKWTILLIMPIVHVTLSAMFGKLLAYFLYRGENEFDYMRKKTLTTLIFALSNATSIPLPLFDTIAKTSSYFRDDPLASDRGFAQICLYGSGFTIGLFTYGLRLTESIEKAYEARRMKEAPVDAEIECVMTECVTVTVSTPSGTQSVETTTMDIVHPTQPFSLDPNAYLDNFPFIPENAIRSSVGHTSQSYASGRSPRTNTSHSMFSMSLLLQSFGTRLSAMGRMIDNKITVWREYFVVDVLVRCFTNPNVVATMITMFLVLFPDIKGIILGQDAPLAFVGNTLKTVGFPTLSISTILLAASLGDSSKAKAEDCEAEKNQRRNIIIICVCKLVILPAIAMMVIYPILPYLSDDPSLRLVVLMECYMPAAQSVVNLCQMYGLTTEARSVTAIYLPMYLASVATLTLGTIVSLKIVFHE